MLKRIANRIGRDIRIGWNKRKAHQQNIGYSPPNYIYKKCLGPESVVVDVGCADDPDMSLFMMKAFDVRVVAVDPTRRHFPALQALQEKHAGKFTHLPVAVANRCEQLQFHESATNVSGSLLSTHNNVVKDETISYEVEAITIPELRNRIDAERIDFLKLDLEGIEYELINEASKSDFDGVDQLFVEFHHHCIPEYSIQDTQQCAHRITSFGFDVFSLDGHNFLFWK